MGLDSPVSALEFLSSLKKEESEQFAERAQEQVHGESQEASYRRRNRFIESVLRLINSDAALNVEQRTALNALINTSIQALTLRAQSVTRGFSLLGYFTRRPPYTYCDQMEDELYMNTLQLQVATYINSCK